ncbi:hypothetical protein J5500_01310 [Candidatus Saccharibacteria bacterium]|nr:hypothetical protein [Candidatus Saccharibacteria bacterium]
MKRLFLLIAAILMGLFATTGCGSTAAKAENDEDRLVITPPLDLQQTTTQHKLDAYERFMAAGGKMTAFSNSDLQTFDLNQFLDTLGLDYVVKDSHIIITPNVPYFPDDDFEYVINFEGDIIRGHDLYVGNNDNERWSMTEHYDSATDFIFQTSLDKQVYQIGADEFDYMYRNLRILTTPVELIREVNEAIDAELAYTG